MLVIAGNPQGGAGQAGDISGWHLETDLSKITDVPRNPVRTSRPLRRASAVTEGERASVSRSNWLVSDLDGGFSRGHRLDPFSQWMR